MIQQISFSSLFCRRSLRAVLTQAEKFTLRCCPSNFFPAHHGVAHTLRYHGGCFWRGYFCDDRNRGKKGERLLLYEQFVSSPFFMTFFSPAILTVAQAINLPVPYLFQLSSFVLLFCLFLFLFSFFFFFFFSICSSLLLLFLLLLS